MICYFKGESGSRDFINFKGRLALFGNIKNGCITLEKAEENQKNFKSDINEIVKGKYKSENPKSAIKNIKALYESQEKDIKLFNDSYKFASEAKYRSIYGEGLPSDLAMRLKILTPKHMLQRLPIVLAQVKAGNTSENLLNEIRQIIHSLYREKEITKKVYNNIMNSIKLQDRMNIIFMNFKDNKTSDPHRPLLNITDKLNLKISDKYVALLNLSIYYTWKNIKTSYKNNKSQISAPTWNEEFELPDGSYFVSDIQD